MGGIFLKSRGIFLLGILVAAALVPTVVGASTWCGDNGLIRFSFVAGDSLVTVLETGEPEGGVTTFDLYAWLTDVTPVAQDGEAFLHLGGLACFVARQFLVHLQKVFLKTYLAG